MALMNRSLVTIDDLSNREIEALFSLADEMADSMGEQFALCQGKVMASLFFEPSTRTRLSFETAMHRLGGSVVSVADVKATSLAKGESIADMARVVGSYADIIVIRHPWEGAARVVADYAGVPVINAGDGGHVHSLAYALARFGATILFHPGQGLEMPEHVIRKLTAEYGGELRRFEAVDTGGELFPLDAIYMTPSQPHQLAMMPDVSLQVELETGVDALYVTRLQQERLSDDADNKGMKDSYPVVDKKLLNEKEFEKTMVMHPLPRVDELACDLDSDPRSMYFKQAARGVPVRMALVALLLGVKQTPVFEEEVWKKDYPVYRMALGIRCRNPKCVSTQDTEAKYIKPQFQIVGNEPVTLRCMYCEHDVYPPYIASSEWHDGTLESKKYHSADSHWSKSIKPENLIVFDSKEEAETNGFKPSHFVSNS